MTETVMASACYRSARFSPLQHRANDAAVLDAVIHRLEGWGWVVERLAETELEAGRQPRGQVVVNMCQGRRAAERLLSLDGGAVMINRADSVLGCHRERLVATLERFGLPFPATRIISSLEPEPGPESLPPGTDGTIWVKRSDVHAEVPEDVVATSPRDLALTLRGFAARGIGRVAIQPHVPGPVVKFYGVTGDRFFHWYFAQSRDAAGSAVDPGRLRELAFAAAGAVGLEIFGGDAVVADPERPVLIDLNDWPSFAPVRDAASAAIADYIHQQALAGRLA